MDLRNFESGIVSAELPTSRSLALAPISLSAIIASYKTRNRLPDRSRLPAFLPGPPGTRRLSSRSNWIGPIERETCARNQWFPGSQTREHASVSTIRGWHPSAKDADLRQSCGQ